MKVGKFFRIIFGENDSAVLHLDKAKLITDAPDSWNNLGLFRQKTHESLTFILGTKDHLNLHARISEIKSRVFRIVVDEDTKFKMKMIGNTIPECR